MTQFAERVNKARPSVPLAVKKVAEHIKEGGNEFAQDGKVHPIRYALWLLRRYAASKKLSENYLRHKNRVAERNRDSVRSAQEIGEIPEVGDPKRKERCSRSFRTFCDEYFADVYYLPWSKDHLRVIDLIEETVLHGGLYAVAMPRGSGKTTLLLHSILWATLYGKKRFAVLVAAKAERAEELLEEAKIILETNDKIIEDFPEVAYPVAKLERIAARQRGQKYRGRHTRILWGSGKIQFPVIEGAVTSGIAIRSSGTDGGSIRGQRCQLEDGSVVRPDLVMVDDPQTFESSCSERQCEKLMKVLKKDILGMAGPGKKIAALTACTIIHSGDVADVLTDKKQSPEWRGERSKLVYKFPENESLWDEYARIRAESFLNDGNGSQATEFYAAHREAMDKGAVVAWPERFDEDEISAVQHAMNLKLRDLDAFMSEYQNDPVPEEVDEPMLTNNEIIAKTNGVPRGVVPEDASIVTAFIDIQKRALFWMGCAWETNFTGYVIDYGVWPRQTRRFSTLANLKETLETAYPQAGLEGQIYSGLKDLTEILATREWKTRAGDLRPLNRILIDARWGYSTDTVFKFCEASNHRNIIYPSFGKAVTASSRPISEIKRKRGETRGRHWQILPGNRRIRRVDMDVNYWKTFLHTRLAVPIGDQGSLSLYGNRGDIHTVLADHLTAEYFVSTFGQGRRVDEWKMKDTRADNHWFDCAVGCAVAASICGAEIASQTGVAEPKRKKMSIAELWRRSQERNLE